MRRGYRPAILALCAALTVLMALPASATDAERIRQLEEKLEKSLQLIDALSRKVEALEGRQQHTSTATPPPPPVRPAADDARLATLEKQLEQLEEARVEQAGASAGLPLHGFADVTAGYSDENNSVFGRGSKGFAVGTLDLYLTPRFGSRVRSLIELVIEMEEEGEPISDLERAQVGYVFSDALTLWLGRYHNPFGYWNTAYHHGAQLQTSVLRPRFIEFEDAGGIVPAHGVGLWATGKVGMAGTLGYDLYVSNSPDIVGSAGGAGTLDVKVTGRDEFHAMGGLTLSWSPSASPGLRVGVSALRGRIAADNGNATRLNMVGGFAALTRGPWEVMGEAYRFRNRDLSGSSGTHDSSAWYLQAAYQLGRTLPYARVEQTDLDQQDNFFADQFNGRSYRRAVLGLHYVLDPRAALKFEYDRTTKQDLDGDDDSFDQARVQYAIRF